MGGARKGPGAFTCLRGGARARGELSGTTLACAAISSVNPLRAQCCLCCVLPWPSQEPEQVPLVRVKPDPDARVTNDGEQQEVQ